MIKPYNNGVYLLFIFLISPVVFSLSYLLLFNYTSGDQLHYHSFYQLISGLSYQEAGVVALSYIGSGEPLSILALWAGSNLGFDKNIYISLLNLVLVLGVILFCKKNTTPFYIILLILTNFYLIVLLTGAERLKIAYIFLVWAFVFKSKLRYFLTILSPFAHFQSLILLVCIGIALLSSNLKKYFHQNKKSYLLYFLILAAFVVFLLYFQEYILVKASSYFKKDFKATEIVNVIVLFIISLLATKNKSRLFFAILPLLGAVAVIGGQRVNMIAVTFILGMLIIERRVTHPLITILLLYFSFKSIFFVLNIFDYGDGFAGFLL